jgi:Hemolysins and related proteins containing CBS domains
MEPPLLGSSFYVSILLFIISLIACAVFSFIETSITALRLFNLKEMASKTSKYKFFFENLEKQPQTVLITIIISKCLADVTTSALSTQIMERVFKSLKLSGGLGFSMGIAIAAVAMLVFGEIIPKNLAKLHGEKILKSVLWLANLIFRTLRPVAITASRFSDFLFYRIGGKKALESSSDWVASEKEIQFLIGHITEKGLMETKKTEMLQNIFDLGTTPIKEVMVPSTDVVSINANCSLADALEIFSEQQFTRYPVYEGKIDNIIGILQIKDVFILKSQHENKIIKDIIRPVSFIPESVKVNQLLKEMQEQHQHMAMVVNEFGSITGIVTLEDILEEIVGEISDEYESTEEKIINLSHENWLIDASVALDELEDLLKISFEADEAVTLGGFLTEQLQHLPKKGDQLDYANYCFQVQSADQKRVHKVLVFNAANLKS